MAKTHFTQAAPAASVNDSPKVVSSLPLIVENLLEEIANEAYATELRLRETPADNPELFAYEVEVLRGVVAKLGWLADLALARSGKHVRTVHGGDAVAWLLSSVTADSFAPGVQS